MRTDDESNFSVTVRKQISYRLRKPASRRTHKFLQRNKSLYREPSCTAQSPGVATARELDHFPKRKREREESCCFCEPPFCSSGIKPCSSLAPRHWGRCPLSCHTFNSCSVCRVRRAAAAAGRRKAFLNCSTQKIFTAAMET